jgi:hypothetical protein
MNLSGFSQFCCDKILLVFSAMQFEFEFETGSEMFDEVLVEHQVTMSHDSFTPLVQKISGEEVKRADLNQRH